MWCARGWFCAHGDGMFVYVGILAYICPAKRVMLIIINNYIIMLKTVLSEKWGGVKLITPLQNVRF